MKADATPLLLLLTPAELTRDPRARRAFTAAGRAGIDVVGACVGGAEPVPIEGLSVVRIARDALSAGQAGRPRRAGALRREARGLFRVARLLRTTIGLTRACRPLSPTIVHANDFDTLPAAALIARRHRARLVYDAHELYTGFEAHPPRVYAALLRRVEGIIARRADAVVTVSPDIAAALQKLHRLRAAPLVAMNCPSATEARAGALAPGDLRVIYQAAVGPGRVVADLFDAALAAEHAHITVRVAGADAAALTREAGARGVDGRIDVSEPVLPDDLVSALARFDVGVVIDRPATLNVELALPNKLFEYLMAGLAVVVPRLQAMAALVDGEGVGLTYEPGSPDDLGRALAELAADRPRLEGMKRKARSLACSRYNAEAQEPALLAAWGL